MDELERQLHSRVDEVLYYVWDPIGVAYIPAARDEYFSYVPAVFAMLQDGADASCILKYLDDVATARMGLEARPEHAKRVVQLLLDWKTEIYLTR